MEKQKRRKESARPVIRSLGISGGLLLAANAILFAAKKISGFAEWYAENIYTVWVNTTGRLFGIIPFSMSEMILYLLIGYLLIALGVFTISVIKRKKKIRECYRGALLVVRIASILFLLFALNCGVNYRRITYAEKLGYRSNGSGLEELHNLSQDLTQAVNRLAEEVERDENGICVVNARLNQNAVGAMTGLGEKIPVLKGYYPRPKKVGYSEILSVQKLTGVYSPFTVEALYNGALTGYSVPFAICHELAHMRGFMQEDEANFIAYQACTNSELPEFQYSGYLEAWIYVGNELYKLDKEAYLLLYQNLSGLVKADLKDNNEFWKPYNTPVAKVAAKVNDTYLKVNGTKDGVRSYNRMVNLLVEEYKSRSMESVVMDRNPLP